MPKTLKDLTAQELLALAIQAEEEDGRIYADLARRLGGDFPATGKSLQAMHDEEDASQQRGRARDLGGLAGRQEQAQRAAQGIAEQVGLGGQSTSGKRPST